jgi:hypothetical protein
MALSAAQGAISANAQSRLGKNQARVHATNQGLAAAQAQRNYEANAKREAQEAQKAAQEQALISRRTEQALGQTRVGAGASGTGGVSFATALRDIRSQEVSALGTSQENFLGVREQLAMANISSQAQHQTQVMSTQPTLGTGFDFLGTALQVGATGITSAVAADYGWFAPPEA